MKYGIVSYQNIFLCLHNNLHYFALPQHVAHECMGHMCVTITSGLLSGSSRSTTVTQFQLWIWHLFWHENLRGYQDNFLYKIPCYYSKDSQNLELSWFTIDYTHCIIICKIHAKSWIFGSSENKQSGALPQTPYSEIHHWNKPYFYNSYPKNKYYLSITLL